MRGIWGITENIAVGGYEKGVLMDWCGLPMDGTGGNFMRQYLRLVRLPAGRRRRGMIALAKKAFKEERGGEVLEYALILGLIVIGCVSTITCVGSKVLSRWNSVDSQI